MADPQFDLARVAALVLQHGFKRVVLQFPDEALEHCVGVYMRLQELLGEGEGSSDGDGGSGGAVSMFIAADSTYGSSVDDISAQHVDGDVLVYFGSDLSSSGAMPVMVVPVQIAVDVEDCIASLSRVHADVATSEFHERILLLYEPGCQHAVASLVAGLERPGMVVLAASLPPCADLLHWDGASSAAVVAAASGGVRLGGLVVAEESIGAASSTVIYYVGDKEQQRDNILLHLSQHALLAYSPRSRAVVHIKGAETKVFRQRYLGVQAVSAAKIVGIIIGSMGLTGESTRDIIRRLQQLLEAAGKRHYSFVMGRLNEAKICNFPEIDLFCFVSNEDVSVIPPKTFDRPVITPWELELGLGAREWESSYQLNPTAIMGSSSSSGGGDGGGGEQDAVARERQWQATLARVRAARPEGNGIDDDVDDDEGEERAKDDLGGDSVVGPEGRLIVPGTRALAIFHSAAGEHFKQREFQGLDPDVPAGQSTAVQQGLFGIAAGYERKEA